jgi:hypothetical protein
MGSRNLSKTAEKSSSSPRTVGVMEQINTCDVLLRGGGKKPDFLFSRQKSPRCLLGGGVGGDCASRLLPLALSLKPQRHKDFCAGGRARQCIMDCARFCAAQPLRPLYYCTVPMVNFCHCFVSRHFPAPYI